MKINNNECTELGVVAIITPRYYFKIKKKYIYFMFMGILLPCMFVYHVYAVSKEVTEGTGFLGLELRDDCDMLPYGCWEEQSVLPTAESSFQPYLLLFQSLRAGHIVLGYFYIGTKD